MNTAASDSSPLLGERAARYLASVDQHMLELLDTHSGPIAAAARGPIAAGGKRLRPLLVLASRPLALDDDAAAARGFDASAIRAGAAVELIHTASLVHDDLLDGAELRRGEPTIGATAGRESAVAAGDLLFSLAFATLVECRGDMPEAVTLRAVRVLARAARTLAEGEAMQARQLRDVDLGESGYLDRCAAKTGVLFAASLQLGAILGGAELDDVDVLARFGQLVGTAFQLADDVLDCGTPETEELLGKRPGADVRDGTITLPMIRAMQIDLELADVLRKPELTDADVEDVLQRIRDSGALDSARDTAHELRLRAEHLLGEVDGRFALEPLQQVAAASVDRLS
ncbi:MAG: polyprenyl synthetase family protein [Gaiellales bacterium]